MGLNKFTVIQGESKKIIKNQKYVLYSNYMKNRSKKVMKDSEQNNETKRLTVEKVLPSGKTLYLTFDKITEDNISFWIDFQSSSVLYAEIIRRVDIFFEGMDDIREKGEYLLEKMQDEMDLLRIMGFKEEPMEFCRKLCRCLDAQVDANTARIKFKKIKETIEGTMAGADSHLLKRYKNDSNIRKLLLDPSIDPKNREKITKELERRGQLNAQVKEKTFIAYGSIKKPDPGDDAPPSPEDIVISVPVSMEGVAPTYTQFGLIKNPLYVADDDFRNLTMILSGFIADSVRHFEDRKRFLSTNPLPALVKLMTKAIGEKNIHIVGSNEAEEYGKDIVIKDGEKYTIVDPDSGKKSEAFDENSLTYAGHNPKFPTILVKADYLELFYKDDHEKMLMLLKSLKKSGSTLPPGLTRKIEMNYPDIKKYTNWRFRRSLTLDDAIKHYEELSLPSHKITKSRSGVSSPRRIDSGGSQFRLRVALSGITAAILATGYFMGPRI